MSQNTSTSLQLIRVKTVFQYQTKVTVVLCIGAFFLLTPGVRSFALTNPGSAQALDNEFFASAPRLNQGANS